MTQIDHLTRLAALADQLAQVGHLALAVQTAQEALDSFLADRPRVRAVLDRIDSQEAAQVVPEPVVEAKPRRRAVGYRKGTRPHREFPDGIRRYLWRSAFHATVCREVKIGVVETIELEMADKSFKRRGICWLSETEALLVCEEVRVRRIERKAAKAALAAKAGEA